MVKGIEYGSFARPSQLIQEAIGPRPISVLSGPSHAEELARGLPASVVVSGTDEPLNEQIRDALSHDAFRVYTSTDALGVELAGALKNILGIAAGICDGLGSGDNAKAALITRGLVEITRLGVDLGARHETFLRPGGCGRRRHDLLQSVWPQSLGRRADRPRGNARSGAGRDGQRRRRSADDAAACIRSHSSAESRCRSRPSFIRSCSRESRLGRPWPI